MEFFEIPDRARKNRAWRNAVAVATLVFNLFSLPANARPAIEVLQDTTRCVATYDAAHKAAELSGQKRTVERFAREQKTWRRLLAALAQLIMISRDLSVVPEIRDSLATLYKEQFNKIIRSVATNDGAILARMHDRCGKLTVEVRSALTPPAD